MTHHLPSPSLAEIIASLESRGFLDWPARRLNLDLQKVQLQLDAVIEEAGDLARILRRHGQGRASVNRDELAVEAADIVIAAVALFANAAGMDTDEILTAKLRSDEARGWLHSGLTREQYKQTHSDRN